METVINQHSIDMEALYSSRFPLSGVTHMGDASSTQFAGKHKPTKLLNAVWFGMEYI